jgi:phosphoglycolate phosphatase-like HAD superfamily hydrolase
VSAKKTRADARPAGVVPLEAVLLDIDGTLLDSNDAHAQAWSDALREAGFEIGSEVVRPLIGMGGDKLLPELTGIDAESAGGKRLVERRTVIFKKEYLPSVRPFPNATDLLDRLRSDGLKLVVATSASDEELHGLLGALGDKSLLEDATSSSDADRSKPDPDIIHAAVTKADASAAACVMLGDTPYDVAAARKAGVQIIALRCGGWGDDALAGAAEVYDDPKQLLEKYRESLIGRRVSEAATGGASRKASGEHRRESRGGEDARPNR